MIENKIETIEMNLGEFNALDKKSETTVCDNGKVYKIVIKRFVCPRCSADTVKLVECKVCKQKRCEDCFSWTEHFGTTCWDCRTVTSKFLGYLNSIRESFKEEHIVANVDGSVSCIMCVDARKNDDSCKFHGEEFQINVCGKDR